MTQVPLLAGLRTLAFAGLLALGLGAGRADALPVDTTFELDSGALVAIGDAAFYPSNSSFDVHAEDAGGGLISMTFSNVFFPDVATAGSERFEIDLVGSSFTAIYDPSDGSVEVDSITVHITKFINNNQRDLEGDFTFDLSTGDQPRGDCGSSSAPNPPFHGEPLNASTGAMTLLENECIRTLGGQQFNTVFSLRLSGVLQEVPSAAAPEPASALLLGLGLVCLARSRRSA